MEYTLKSSNMNGQMGNLIICQSNLPGFFNTSAFFCNDEKLTILGTNSAELRDFLRRSHSFFWVYLYPQWITRFLNKSSFCSISILVWDSKYQINSSKAILKCWKSLLSSAWCLDLFDRITKEWPREMYLILKTKDAKCFKQALS